MKNEKSPGPDNLQNEALKTGSMLLARPLTYLKVATDTGQVPEQWKKSDIILLYKKRDPKDVGNRPISLLSMCVETVHLNFILQSRLSSKIDEPQPSKQV